MTDKLTKNTDSSPPWRVRRKDRLEKKKKVYTVSELRATCDTTACSNKGARKQGCDPKGS